MIEKIYAKTPTIIIVILGFALLGLCLYATSPYHESIVKKEIEARTK